MTNPAYQRDAHPVQLVGNAARLECAQCGAHEDWRLDSRPPPEILRKHFSTRGWDLRKRPICPECNKPKKETRPMATVTPLKSEPKPTFDAKAARLAAHELITMTFDIPSGQYCDDYSDERIAKETGIAVDWVKQRREDDFGPLKQPDELTQLRNQLADAAQTLAAIKAQFDKLCAAKGWAA